MSNSACVLILALKTINHRRLVQEVYDEGILHRLLGVQRHDATLIVTDLTGEDHVTSDRTVEAQSVLSSWVGANNETMSDDERGGRQNPRTGEIADESYESESRYDIQQGSPSRKRRRTGTDQDAHIVFTADEEDEEHSGVSEVDSLAEEEAHYDAVHSDLNEAEQTKEPAAGNGLTAAGRRAYWISKGVDMGHDSENE